MVGTAQADSLAIFIRKVGFSVGLEGLLSRAGDFGSRYSKVASFRASDWAALVEKRWRLRSPNVADVFSAFDIARISNQEVYAGSVGESLGIVHKMLAEDEVASAVRYLVASAIVKFDGDIFLNALASDFAAEDTRSALVRMVAAKRDALFDCFHGPRDREAIARVVSIERQKSNRGSATGGGLGMARTTPLGARDQGLGLPSSIDIYSVEEPSSDYIRKISNSRRGWAQSLGLFSGGERTQQGDEFLVGLAKSRFARTDGTFVVWPTSFELEANRFKPENLSSLQVLSTWEFQLAIFQALGGQVESSPPDLSAVSAQIAEVFQLYKELSQHRIMIRNEVSSHIVIAVVLASAMATNRKAPNLSEALRSDLTEFGISVRPSKTIELAISTRPDAN